MSEENLKDFIETASTRSPFRVEDDFGNGFVRLRSEEAERRQAVHDIRCTEDVVIETLRNSRDAGARNIFLATVKEGAIRKIVLIDDGEGVPPEMHQRIFEPRVTSKLDSMHMDKWGVHGRGMALYSIAMNCSEARVVSSDRGQGSSFLFTSDTTVLKEKADQSTFPSFVKLDSGAISVRGPRNVLRTTCEFAIDTASNCTVYLGSLAEIAATLYAFALSSVPASMRVFCKDSSELPVCKRLAAASDPASFCEIAEGIGLTVSERTARRIMDGQIAPLAPITQRVTIEDPNNSAARVKPRKSVNAFADSRGLKLHPDDTRDLACSAKEAFQEIAEKYYLDGSVEPEISVRSDRIVISIPVRKL